MEVERVRRKFEYWNIRIIGISDNIDTYSDGHEFHTGVRGLIDSVYLLDLAKKTHRGLRGQALKGKSCGGRSYGYRHVVEEDPNKTDSQGRPLILSVRREVNEEEAYWVRQIFSWYAQGFSPRWIASELNRRGVPSPRKSTWAASTLHGDQSRGTGLLNNPLYIGKYVWNRSKWGRHPDTRRRIRHRRPPSDWVEIPIEELRIVSDELWESVKRRQNEKRVNHSAVQLEGSKASPVGRGPKYLFSGLLKCAECSRNYIVTNRNQYACSTRINRGEIVCSNRLRVSRKLVEGLLMQQIKQDLLSPEGINYFLKETRRILNEKRSKLPQSIDENYQQLLVVEKEIKNLVRAFRRGDWTESTKSELHELESKKQQLQTMLKTESQGRGNLQSFLPRAKERLRELVWNIENLDHGQLVPIRQQIKTLVGGEIKLFPTDQGYLEAEVSGDYAGFLKLIGEERTIMMVAGEGFEPSTFGL